jgi:hypothetical protein
MGIYLYFVVFFLPIFQKFLVLLHFRFIFSLFKNT